MPGAVLRLPPNRLGRDFVVGDVHGCFTSVAAALREARFSSARDRLLCVGDLVDRGPESARCLGFLRLPWVHAVRGNHEDMWLDLYSEGEPDPATLEFATRSPSTAWWRDLGARDRAAIVAEFRKMPVAMEIPTRRGTVGVTHADVPPGMGWAEFLRAVEAGDPDVTRAATWGRRRIRDGDMSGVPGIGRLFVGHTPVPSVTRMGNVFDVDTGAVFGLPGGRKPGAGLTVARVECMGSELVADGGGGDVRVIGATGPHPPGPFGSGPSSGATGPRDPG